MKIAIAAAGMDLDAPTDPRFGRCQAFVVVDTETMGFQALENTAAMQGSGAGIAAVQLVAATGVDAVVADNLGPNAFQALSAGGLKVYRFSGGSVRQAVEALVAGQLEEIGGANVVSHHGMGAGTAGASAPGASRTGTQQLSQQADALEAQLQDVRRQIADLRTRQGQGD
jgi:predicted Fe-Mo cluster-binding NifX family protein